ncbi:MAG: hypothetical protein WCF67_18705 [Chitinophagaceae bacterium]
MKQVLIIAVIAFTACNQPGKGNSTTDSLGAKAIDTFGRNDTMNYERMQNKTSSGLADSAHNPGRKDTMNYERLQHKTAPKDTTNH